MDYKERIRALRYFKSAVSSGSTRDRVSGLSVAVPDWTGNAQSKFENYIDTVKKDSQKISKRKAEFLSKIDAIIARVQAQFDSELQANSLYLYITYDEDPVENRIKKYRTIKNLSIDKSVKRALLSRV
ncbi:MULTISPECIES: hypothetical protein [Streptococcus]|uniref:hypothetical protein n=1 Tax=Streptococcus TaxID=1301 RepID=UPI000CF7278D|nr:hypothetical protein [Streptococcus suis]MBM7311979.1 hypothetical protein [Streptococcus suis]MBM7318577.1 hypothetical protein [Streptococcus suis]MBY4964236.1 hypothetical protein [Streptococcus suis]MCO8241649.1 hypothetical protein [Streptococcus suis]TII10085.1 hypothetical protein FAJ40_05575 [Streptococcus suis]